MKTKTKKKRKDQKLVFFGAFGDRFPIEIYVNWKLQGTKARLTLHATNEVASAEGPEFAKLSEQAADLYLKINAIEGLDDKFVIWQNRLSLKYSPEGHKMARTNEPCPVLEQVRHALETAYGFDKVLITPYSNFE